jgi:hypothetical protein
MSIRAKIMNDSNIIIIEKHSKIFLPAIEQKDFFESKKLIDDFHHWADHDDYLDEIEGYCIGLTSAGLDARLVPISIRGFLSWARHASLKPTLSNLSEFARIVTIGRENVGNNFKIEFKIENGQKAAVRLRSGAGDATVAVSRDLYEAWRHIASTLRFRVKIFTAEAYFRLLLESWIETP